MSREAREIHRGQIWWADLPEPRGSEPGYRRPVLIVQADTFNGSRIRTVIVAVITTNLRLAGAPGNVFLPAEVTTLPHDSVVNVSQLLTIDRSYLDQPIRQLPANTLKVIDQGLRTVLCL